MSETEKEAAELRKTLGLLDEKVVKPLEEGQRPKRVAYQGDELTLPEYSEVLEAKGEGDCFFDSVTKYPKQSGSKSVDILNTQRIQRDWKSSNHSDYNDEVAPKEELIIPIKNSDLEESSKQPKKHTSKQNSEKFQVQTREGTTFSYNGHLYEYHLLILGRFRAQRYTDKFYLISNISGVGAFDDIVFRYWEEKNNRENSSLLLMQAKLLQNPRKGMITIEKFLNPNNDKFYLGKYFPDYLISRKKIENKSNDPAFSGNPQVKYIIYTNAILYEKFDENRIIDIEVDSNIFFTKSEKSKAFKFIPNKNPDIIKLLENVSCRKRIESFANDIVSCICGDLNHNNMMGNELFSTYHVFLAKNVINVSKEIKIDETIKYREGTLNQNFLSTDDDDKDELQKQLKKQILYEYAKNVMFNNKSSSKLGDEHKNNLVNKVAELCDKKEVELDKDIIQNLGGSAIILDKRERKLKFADIEHLKDASDEKQFIRDLQSKVSNLDKYRFNIPYELVKNILVAKKEPLKLHVGFGNISPNFKEPKHLVEQLIKLIEEHKSQKVIEINENIVGHEKLLTHDDINDIGKLVGNLLVFDQEVKMLKFASEESLDENALKLFNELKTTVLEIDSYRFDIKIKKFPKNSLDINFEERTNIKEFLNLLEIFTGQANNHDLKQVIKKEIIDLYKLTKKEAEDNYLKIKDKGEVYWSSTTKIYLEKDDDFYQNILRFSIAFDVRNSIESFTGRVEQLEKLHKALQNKGKTTISQTVSISGLGGIGKTELARKYAYDNRNYYDGNVIWINAESYQTLVKSFSRLAQDKLGINVQRKDIKSIVEDVYDFFSNRKSLFIFDNAKKLRTQDDGDEGIDKFLPSWPSDVNKHYILITSRNQKWGDVDVILLDTFTEKEATDFIIKTLNIEDDLQKNEIQKLLKKLQLFPLALTQAVTYIKQADEALKNVEPVSEFKIKDYLDEYEKKTEELLNFPFPDDSNDTYTRTTFTTFQVSISMVKEKKYGEKALEMLEIIAYLAPDDIPTKMFLKLGEDDVRKLGDIVQLLRQYSMINLKGNMLNVHRLVQEVTRINVKEENRDYETLRKCLELNGLTRAHLHSIWNYASKYDQLINDFHSSYSVYRIENIMLNAYIFNVIENGIKQGQAV